jgi:hypothetical protein
VTYYNQIKAIGQSPSERKNNFYIPAYMKLETSGRHIVSELHFNVFQPWPVVESYGEHELWRKKSKGFIVIGKI